MVERMINYGIKFATRIGPHIKKVEENRKRVYELSRYLPEEEGYELINLFNESINETQKVCKKRYELQEELKEED